MATLVDDDRASMLTLDTPIQAQTSMVTLGMHNGSQVTLIDPQLPGAAAVLVFSADSHFNSTISLFDRPIYRLRSNQVGTKTDVLRIGLDGEEDLIVTYDRKLLGSVLVRPDGEKMKVSKYIRPLKTRPEGAKHGAAFDFMGTTYEWRIDMLGKMACYTQGAPMLEPLAWYNRKKKGVDNGQAFIRPSAMGLKEEAARLPLRDQIVISWMIVNDTARTWPYNVQ